MGEPKAAAAPGVTETAGSGIDSQALRTEHDALARRLEIRVSIDEARKGIIRLFFGLIAVGMTVKLAWDRWGVLRPGVVRKIHSGPPVFLWIAGAVALLLLVLAVRALFAARRLARDEDRLFGRFREIRAQLELDR